jgi:hypothetical protein
MNVRNAQRKESIKRRKKDYLSGNIQIGEYHA